MNGTIPWARELATTAQAFGDLVCVHDGIGTLTFRDLAARAAGLAHRLLAAGVKPGEPVASFLRNSIPAVWASYGVRITGAAEMPLNPALTEDERRYCVTLVGARHVVTIAAHRAFFAGLGVKVVTVDEIAAVPDGLDAIAPAPADAFGRIIFTSGTTGRPKAIVHTHGSRWLANLLQRATLPYTPQPGDRALLMTPFSHGAALIAFAYLEHGAAVELRDGVDLAAIEKLLSTRAVDAVFSPPTVLAKLAEGFAGRHFPGIRVVFCGTSTLTPALYAKARALFGPAVRITYGKSEVVNPITILPPAACERYYCDEPAGEGACVGWPANGVEVEVRRDDATRAEIDEVAEVHLRARHMLVGHIDEQGFHPLAPGDFHATGDLGRLDAHGRLHLVGRTADVIKSGGYKIFPEEIERALAGAAGALAVVTLPSDYWGEVIVAVAEAPAPGWEDKARAAVECLAKYKHPRAYVALDALPRNPQGKISRRDVRAMVMARWELADGARPGLRRR